MTTPPFIPIPSSPLAHKRRRFDATANLPSPSFRLVASEDEDEDDEMVAFTPQLMAGSQPAASFSSSDGLNPLSSSSPSPSPPDSSTQISTDLSARMQQSANHLEAASQAVRLRIAHKEQSDKSTTASYERHVNAYTVWWDMYQAGIINEDPTQVAIPAFPVTPAKATMFLEYTSTRPKVRAPFHCLMCYF